MFSWKSRYWIRPLHFDCLLLFCFFCCLRFCFKAVVRPAGRSIPKTVPAVIGLMFFCRMLTGIGGELRIYWVALDVAESIVPRSPERCTKSILVWVYPDTHGIRSVKADRCVARESAPVIWSFLRRRVVCCMWVLPCRTDGFCMRRLRRVLPFLIWAIATGRNDFCVHVGWSDFQIARLTWNLRSPDDIQHSLDTSYPFAGFRASTGYHKFAGSPILRGFPTFRGFSTLSGYPIFAGSPTFPRNLPHTLPPLLILLILN